MKPENQGVMNHYPVGKIEADNTTAGTQRRTINLNKTNLSFVEISPETTFKSEANGQEQALMITEGVLYIKQGIRVIAAKAGDAVTIPDRAAVMIFTRTEGAKITIAWPTTP